MLILQNQNNCSLMLILQFYYLVTNPDEDRAEIDLYGNGISFISIGTYKIEKLDFTKFTLPIMLILQNQHKHILSRVFSYQQIERD